MGSRKPFLNTLLGVIVAAGCVNESTGPSPRPEAALAEFPTASLLSCTPLPETSVSEKIGKKGGTVQVGPHRLVVPPNAVSTSVTITATTGGELVNSVKFGPAGLQFAVPAELSLSVANCPGWGQIKKLVFAYTDDSFSILELLNASTDNQTKSIVGEINHFSRYAVAY